MTETLRSILSAVKQRPLLAKPEEESASHFLLDEAKFLAEIMRERAASLGGSLKVAAR